MLHRLASMLAFSFLLISANLQFHAMGLQMDVVGHRRELQNIGSFIGGLFGSPSDPEEPVEPVQAPMPTAEPPAVPIAEPPLQPTSAVEPTVAPVVVPDPVTEPAGIPDAVPPPVTPPEPVTKPTQAPEAAVVPTQAPEPVTPPAVEPEDTAQAPEPSVDDTTSDQPQDLDPADADATRDERSPSDSTSNGAEEEFSDSEASDGVGTAVIVAIVVGIIVTVVVCVICFMFGGRSCGGTRPRPPPPIAQTPPPPNQGLSVFDSHTVGMSGANHPGQQSEGASRIQYGPSGLVYVPKDKLIADAYSGLAIKSPGQQAVNQHNRHPVSQRSSIELASAVVNGNTHRHPPVSGAPGAVDSLAVQESHTNSAASKYTCPSPSSSDNVKPRHNRGDTRASNLSSVEGSLHPSESGIHSRLSNYSKDQMESVFEMDDVRSSNCAAEAQKYMTRHGVRQVTVVPGEETTLVNTVGGSELLSVQSSGAAALLERQLDWIEKNQNGILIGKYKLAGVAQRRRGGQGMVAFVTDTSGAKHYAVKFYFAPGAFLREKHAATEPTLAHAVPECVDIVEEPQDRTLPEDQGTLPLMIVTEKGECLREFMKRRLPDYVTSLQVIVQIAEKLRSMHEAGYAHRDLKPGNTIWLSSLNTWSLIDFGCTARVGSEVPVCFTLMYAAPETVQAFANGESTQHADSAVDTFAFGIMCFELLTRMPYYPSSITGAAVGEMLAGQKQLPHEMMSNTTAKKLGVLKSCDPLEFKT